MTENKKIILEEVHRKIENIMLEKAELTLKLEREITEGKPLSEESVNRLRQIDEAIHQIYAEQIKIIKNNAKELRTLAKKEYGKPVFIGDKTIERYALGTQVIELISSPVASKLYHDNDRIDPYDIPLFNKLLEEMDMIVKEQKALWGYQNKKGISKSLLESLFRGNIKNMQSIMPQLRDSLKEETSKQSQEKDKMKESLDALKEDIEAREKRYGSKRNKKLYQEKKEVRKIESEYAKLDSKIKNNESLIEESQITPQELDERIAKIRQDNREQNEKRKQEIKEQRRLENERRHQENLKRQEEKEAEQNKVIEENNENKEPEETVVSIEKPKNKKNLKERLKKGIAVILAAAALLTAGMGIFKKFHKKDDIQKEMNKETDEQVELVIPGTYGERRIEDKGVYYDENTEHLNINQAVESTEKKEESFEQESVEEEKNIESKTYLGQKVKLNGRIYQQMHHAINHISPLYPSFSDKEYTIIGVDYSNGKRITLNSENYQEIEKEYISEGHVPLGYYVTIREVKDINLEKDNVLLYTTGFAAADEVEYVELSDVNERSR